MSENGERDEVEWVMCETATGRVLDRWTEPAPTDWRTPDPLPEGDSMSDVDRRQPDLEAIVRDLANDSPNVETGDMYHECGLCGASLPTRPEHHDESCPWRRAIEWVRTADSTEEGQQE